jgi:thiosulfate/3-mercaptopyruvate sulfurtransferase
VNKLDKRILIVAEELHESLKRPETVVIDCRFELADPDAGRRAFEQAHIPGSVFLDLDKDLAGPITEETGRHPLPDPHALAGTLGDLGVSRTHDVVVYDGSHGGIAARAWWTLRWLGHERVRLLDGGFLAWKNRGLPLEAGTTARTGASFEPRVRHELVVTTAELSALPGAPADLKLCDARDSARFRGEQEPIDPVAGHIPGSRSLPFSEFVGPDGLWKPLEQRAALINSALEGKVDGEWSVMCGSGVTACHLAISALEAGFREPRVYIGSWSEWIRDPQRPISAGGD